MDENKVYYKDKCENNNMRLIKLVCVYVENCLVIVASRARTLEKEPDIDFIRKIVLHIIKFHSIFVLSFSKRYILLQIKMVVYTQLLHKHKSTICSETFFQKNVSLT